VTTNEILIKTICLWKFKNCSEILFCWCFFYY